MNISIKLRHGILSAGLLAFAGSLPLPAHAGEGQIIFLSPEQAVESLVSSARNDRTVELLKILGSGADKLVNSGDEVADHESRARFVAAYDKSHKLEDQTKDREVLIIGDEDWPMPIPLVHDKLGWRFDSAAGEQEILNRRIGRNELNVIEVCRSYVEAQREFAALHPLAGNKHDYAQKFFGDATAHDGLYWPVKEGEAESPLGPLMAKASAEGYPKAPDLSPYHGYYFRILKAQGPHAAGGAMDYVADGHMPGGFAMVAFPATYGDSGVMTFIVNHNGIVYEKNLGPQTADIAIGMTQYDPDETWNIVQDQ